MEAIVLAGGFGRRLKSVVSNIPKPMATIKDKPFLLYIIENLNEQNIKKVILSVGYKHKVIKDYFGDKYKEIDIVYSIEDEPLGTGGAIKKAFEMIKAQHVFILNGDTFFDVDLEQLFVNHLKNQSDLTLALKPMKDFDRYGTVTLLDKKVVCFEEKRYRKQGNINGGVYVANRDLFNKIKMPQKFSFENDFMISHIDSLKLNGYISDKYFIDIGIPQDYEKAQNDFPKIFYDF